MAAVEGIFLAVLVVASIAAMLYVANIQYGIIDTFTDVTAAQQEISQEDVDLNIDPSKNNSPSELYIKNKSQLPVTIVEMRVLDEQGSIIATCDIGDPAIAELASGEKLSIGNATIVNGNDIRLDSTQFASVIQTCLDKAKVN